MTQQTKDVPEYQAHSLPLITLSTSVVPDSSKSKTFVIATTIDGKDKNIDLFFPFAEALCALGYRFMVSFKNTTKAFEEDCMKLQDQFPEQFHFPESGSYSPATLEKHADIFFSLSYPTKKEIEWLISKSIVPVVPNSGVFVNFKPEAESGNGFTFEEGNFWKMLEATIRARETRKFSYDWRNIREAVRKTSV